MSTVIITDSACELPASVENSKSVKLLPINMIMGDDTFEDTLVANDVLGMLERGEITEKKYCTSEAATKEQIIEFLKSEIIPHYDYAIVQTVSSQYSNQCELWQEVKSSFGPNIRNYRQSDRPAFSLTIIDSGTAYCGQGLFALEAIRLARKAKTKREFIAQMREFTGYVQSYSAPPDVQFLRQRAIQRGDNTVNFINGLIGKWLKISPVIFGMRGEMGLSSQARGHDNAINIILQHAIDAIRKGLKSPFINISYGGPLSDLDKLALFGELKDVALQYDVKVFTSVARLPSLINLGAKTFSLSLASNDPEFLIKSN